MYHSKRQRHNHFNLNKNAKNHNIKEHIKQKNDYIKRSRNKFVTIFQDIISGCEYNEFKIDSKIHYNKFSYMRVIPKGKKGYIWFQSTHNYNSCLSPIFYFERFRNNLQLINNGTSFNLCCNADELSAGDNGTVLYGTLLNHNNTQYFNVENIYYYKNKNVSKDSWDKKLRVMNDLFTNNIKQLSYGRNDITLLSCLTQKLPHDVISIKTTVPYNIHCIQYLFEYSSKLYYKLETEKETIKEQQYNIKANLNHDDYDIYTVDKHKYIGKLHVPDYNTSIHLNSIFRNIRENIDLDFLEESDTEEDFQNISLDKYVNLNKIIRVTCAFDTNMNMWKLKNKIFH